MRGKGPNLGVLALVVAAGGLLSGLFLALQYAPTVAEARRSVAHLREEVFLGGFLRGLHHWSGTFALVLAGLHGLRLFWHGAYKPPRARLWTLGCGIFVVLLGFAYTGYLLAGDERALTGLAVMEGVARSTPLVGDAVAGALAGGDRVSSATLARLYVAHVLLLPAALVLLVIAFAATWRKLGPAPRHDEEAAPPAQPARDAAGAITVLALLGLAAWLLPPPLGAEPDPSGTGAADARPEWFLLWVNELLHRVPGATFWVGGVLPAGLLGLGFALPWLARGRERSPARRKPEIAAAAVVLLGLGALTALSLAREELPAAEEPAPPPAASGGDAAARAVIAKFRCTKCHTIDGDEEGGETGPPLDRSRFQGLYTRRFFRLKVGDPLGFWPETGMVYQPRSRKPTEEELDALERFFFDSR